MSSEAYIKFLKTGFHGERLRSLKSDSLRWRWWRLYCLSDLEVFPGIVGKGLIPRTEMEIVGEVYQTAEFKEDEKIERWRGEKKALVDAGLIKVTSVNSHEFIWNVDFHSIQDRHSKKGFQLKDKFYSSFLKLENDRDKSAFIVLLSRFKPVGVDLEAFSVPKNLAQFEAYANKSLPLFGKENREDPGAMKTLLLKVAEDIGTHEVKRKSDRGNSDVKDFMDWYCKRFKKQTTKPYLVGGKDFKLVSDMLKLFSTEELKRLAERFFREPDEYVKRAGHTIGILKLTLNRLVDVKERRPIGLGDFSKWR